MTEINFKLVQTNTASFFRSEQITSRSPSTVWSFIVASNKFHPGGDLDSINHGNIRRLVTEGILAVISWQGFCDCILGTCDLSDRSAWWFSVKSTSFYFHPWHINQRKAFFLRCSVFTLQTGATKHGRVSVLQTRGRTKKRWLKNNDTD